MSAVARRYAQGAVDAAREKGGDKEVETLASGLRGFADAYTGSPAFHEVVLNPALKDERDRALAALGGELGASELAVTTMRLLADSERMSELSDVVLEVEQIADDQLGRARARVLTAIELTKQHKERLSRALEKKIGSPVVLDIEIEPAIQAGLVIQVGSVTIDSSIRRQLEVMSERLRTEF